MTTISNLWRQIAGYSELSNTAEIARRYFAMNAFDGALTIIGVLVGSFLAGVTDAGIILTTGLSTSVAMGVSGLWGAYLTESAERKRELSILERQTLTDLGDTQLGKASRFAVIVVSLVDGLSPFLTAVLILTPFLAADLYTDIFYAYATSLGLALCVLFGLGMFLGHVSRENMFLYGIKTLIAGLLSIGISWLLNAAE